MIKIVSSFISTIRRTDLRAYGSSNFIRFFGLCNFLSIEKTMTILFLRCHSAVYMKNHGSGSFGTDAILYTLSLVSLPFVSGTIEYI